MDITKDDLGKRKADTNAKLVQAQQSFNTLGLIIQQLQGQVFLLDDMLKNIDTPKEEGKK